MTDITRRTGLGALVAGIFGVGTRGTEQGGMNDLMKPSAGQNYNYDGPTTNRIGTEGSGLQSEQDLLAYIQQNEDIVKGKFLPWQQDRIKDYDRNNEDAAHHDIKCLKSISKSYKARMFHNRSIERMKHQWIEEAKEHLVRQLKEKARRGIFG